LEGFWPSSNWKVNYEQASIPTIIDVDLKDLVLLPYCGRRSMQLFLSIIAYKPFCDLFASNFVLVQLANHIIYLVWMGRAESDVVKYQESENYRRSMFNGGFL
jgi:hypothetical protein